MSEKNLNLLSDAWRGYYFLLVFVLVVAFYPVVAVIPFLLKVFSTPISVSYRAGYFTLSVFILGLSLLRANRIKLSKGVIFLIVFFLLYSVRLYYDLVVREIRVYESPAYFFQYAIGGTFVPILALAVSWNKVETDKLVEYLYYFSLISCIAIAGMVFSGGDILEIILKARARVDTEHDSIVGPIIVSREGGFLANLSLFYLLGEYPKKPRKTLLYVTFLLGLLLLIFGASRGPLAAAGLVILLQLTIGFWRRVKSVKFWVRCLLVVGFLLLPLLSYAIKFTDFFQQLTIFNRFVAFSGGGFEKEVRAQQWDASWQQIKSSPIVGERMVENLLGHSPHNLFIEIQLALGLVGSLLFLLTLLYSLKRFYREFQLRTSMVVLHFLLWLYLLYGMTGLSIHTSPQVWLLLAATTYASTTVKQHQLVPN